MRCLKATRPEGARQRRRSLRVESGVAGLLGAAHSSTPRERERSQIPAASCQRVRKSAVPELRGRPLTARRRGTVPSVVGVLSQVALPHRTNRTAVLCVMPDARGGPAVTSYPGE